MCEICLWCVRPVTHDSRHEAPARVRGGRGSSQMQFPVAVRFVRAVSRSCTLETSTCQWLCLCVVVCRCVPQLVIVCATGTRAPRFHHISHAPAREPCVRAHSSLLSFLSVSVFHRLPPCVVCACCALRVPLVPSSNIYRKPLSTN